MGYHLLPSPPPPPPKSKILLTLLDITQESQTKDQVLSAIGQTAIKQEEELSESISMKH